LQFFIYPCILKQIFFSFFEPLTISTRPAGIIGQGHMIIHGIIKTIIGRIYLLSVVGGDSEQARRACVNLFTDP